MKVVKKLQSEKTPEEIQKEAEDDKERTKKNVDVGKRILSYIANSVAEIDYTDENSAEDYEPIISEIIAILQEEGITWWDKNAVLTYAVTPLQVIHNAIQNRFAKISEYTQTKLIGKALMDWTFDDLHAIIQDKDFQGYFSS